MIEQGRIEDLAVFCAIITHGNFSSAARHLRISRAVASARMRRLEAQVGVRLLNRTTRSVAPTDAGRIYYRSARQVLAELEQAHVSLERMGREPEGVVRLSAPSALGRKVIAPALIAFRQAYPQINVRLSLTDQVINLIDDKVDIAIRQGVLADAPWVMRRLASDRRVTCASPQYWALAGVPATPDDLTDHDCLLLRFPGSQRFRWQFVEQGNVRDLAVSGSIDASANDVLVDWAIAGLGVVQQSIWNCHEAVAEGRLMPVLTDFELSDLYIHALTHDRDAQSPKLMLVIDFLKTWLNAV
jgi:DNA-binding transcriptional LysR family regulator